MYGFLTFPHLVDDALFMSGLVGEHEVSTVVGIIR